MSCQAPGRLCFSHFGVSFWIRRRKFCPIIDEVLSLGGAARIRSQPCWVLPDLDSMAVVGLINMLEERFGFIVEDDEIDGSTFACVGSLVEFVDGKLA